MAIDLRRRSLRLTCGQAVLTAQQFIMDVLAVDNHHGLRVYRSGLSSHAWQHLPTDERELLRRLHTPSWIGDVLVGFVVLGLLATAVLGASRVYGGLTTACIPVRYGVDCLRDEPWGFMFSLLASGLGGLCALGSAAFIVYLRIYERD